MKDIFKKILFALLAIIVCTTSVQASELIYTFEFTSDGEDWAASASGGGNWEFDSTDGNPSGSWYMDCFNSGAGCDTGTVTFEWTGTWEDLGIPAGSTINKILLQNAAEDEYTEFNYIAGGGQSAQKRYYPGPFYLDDNGSTLYLHTLISQTNRSDASTDWSAYRYMSADVTVDSSINASDDTIYLKMGGRVKDGSSALSRPYLNIDNIRLIIEYTAPVTDSTHEGSVEVKSGVFHLKSGWLKVKS